MFQVKINLAFVIKLILFESQIQQSCQIVGEGWKVDIGNNH